MYAALCVASHVDYRLVSVFFAESIFFTIVFDLSSNVSYIIHRLCCVIEPTIQQLCYFCVITYHAYTGWRIKSGTRMLYMDRAIWEFWKQLAAISRCSEGWSYSGEMVEDNRFQNCFDCSVYVKHVCSTCLCTTHSVHHFWSAVYAGITASSSAAPSVHWERGTNGSFTAGL